MPELPQTGEDLVIFRVRYRLSRKIFAQKCAVTPQTLAAWEDLWSFSVKQCAKIHAACTFFMQNAEPKPIRFEQKPLNGSDIVALCSKYRLTRIRMAALVGLSPATISLYARYAEVPISASASARIRAAIPAFEQEAAQNPPKAPQPGRAPWRMRLAADPLAGADLTWAGFLSLPRETYLYVWHTARPDFLPDRWHLCRKNTPKSFVPCPTEATDSLPSEVRLDSFPPS